MKTNIDMTFDDLGRMLRALAHDLADRTEAGYLPRARRDAGFRQAARSEAGPAFNEGESHDGAGR